MNSKKDGTPFVDRKGSLFGRPTNPMSSVDRSKEALLLRLESYYSHIHSPTVNSNEENDDHSKRTNPVYRPKRFSEDIPIANSDNRKVYRVKGGHGFTDDMFFASICCSSDDTDVCSSEAFIPPHLLRNSPNSFSFA